LPSHLKGAHQVDRRHPGRLRQHPDEPHLLADQERRLAGDDAEKCALEPGVTERKGDQRRPALRRQRRGAPHEGPRGDGDEPKGEREDGIRGTPPERSSIEWDPPGGPGRDLRQPGRHRREHARSSQQPR